MTNQVLFVKEQGQGDGDRICPRMKKDSQFTLRIPSDLKVQLEEIASSEGRSTAQICEAFLRAGTDNYRRKGSKFIKGFIAQQKKSDPG